MKKITLAFACICLFSLVSSGQLMVTKLLGKDASKYGVGFGAFAFLDFPLRSENQGIRIELAEFAYFPGKGENFFTGTGGKGYASAKLGYKYVFSENQTGFYLLPSAGWGAVVILEEHEEKAKEYHGVAAAIEGGYSLGIGEGWQKINFGLKYEFDSGNSGESLQSIGFRISYSLGLFGRMDD